MGLITEKNRLAVSPVLLTSDGTVDGKMILANASPFRVGQSIVLTSSTQPDLVVKIKRILEGDIVFVGPNNQGIHARTDISAYLVSDSAAVYAEEQQRSKVPEQEIERITYEEEPVIARRCVLVDNEGAIFDDVNRVPTENIFLVSDIPEHHNGSVADTLTPVAITVSVGEITKALIQNPKRGVSANNWDDVLYVSVDGVNYISLARGASASLPGSFPVLYITADKNGVNYEVITWRNGTL